jgi:hypothetical protein
MLWIDNMDLEANPPISVALIEQLVTLWTIVVATEKIAFS